MSLINQMLQDLESRRADAGTGMPNEIRSLPQPRPPVLRPAVLAGLTLILLAGLAVAWWLGEAETVKAPIQAAVKPIVPAPIAPAPSAAPAPAPAPAPDAAATSPAAIRAEGSPSLPPSEARLSPDEAPKLKVSQALDVPPRADKPAPTPAKARADRKSEAPPPAAPPPQVAAEATPAANAGDARIEKKMRVATAQERAENEYRRAVGLVNQGRNQEAMAVLRGALSEDAAHAGARLALFELLVEQQRLDEAQALVAETLQRDPAQPRLAARLARLQLERGDARGARETLDKAAAAAQGDPEYRAFRAAVLQRLTFHHEAVAEYQAALRLAPQAGVWWMGLGISLESDGRPAEAREAYLRARSSGALSAELAAFVEQKLKRIQ